ncbi:alpha/beta fold hydrolase [Streptomyces sp. SAJ15]|uniref:alpha/beta fold hydrolase n=1 Tax=Streptomyces sp. SAJ15 TaxID=2011095 RepID=UPI0016428D6C|nr:alpha/beta hydrolase [Streptomyces sp. SAJ15]
MATILLVHGALADGSCWSEVIPPLQDVGHSVVAVQQPLSSIDDDVARVRAELEAVEEAVVLVGHSFGGVAITQAAHHMPHVSALVYVAAFAPDEGESVAGLTERAPKLPSAERFTVDEGGRFRLSRQDFPRFFCPDVDSVRARVLAAAQGPADAGRFDYRSGPPAWREHPTYYVVAGADQIVHPELQRWLAARMGAIVTTADGAGHAVMVSRPDVVTEVVLAAAAA